LNYYSFVDNYGEVVDMVKYTLLHSCAKTLARKLNLGSRANVFAKFGEALTPRDSLTQAEKTIATRKKKPRLISFYLPVNYQKKTRDFKVGVDFKDPMEILKWRINTQINLFDSCLICGVEEGIQMHHVKHLRKEGQKSSGFLAIMSQLNRKQVPVCQSCHDNIHAGRYDGISLKSLQESHNTRK
jgi:hypothetical protein